MLANEDIELTNLVTISNVITKKENLVGIYLPCFIRIDVNIQDYALLAKPHWVDKAVILLKEILELNVREKIEEERVKLLSSAVKTITQRVNLFDKVLIPKTKVNIRRIKIYLSDEQMASVVRSKIAKRMHAKDVS
jgi:V/A-type H+-transporting ATPase subunit D